MELNSIRLAPYLILNRFALGGMIQVWPSFHSAAVLFMLAACCYHYASKNLIKSLHNRSADCIYPYIFFSTLTKRLPSCFTHFFSTRNSLYCYQHELIVKANEYPLGIINVCSPSHCRFFYAHNSGFHLWGWRPKTIKNSSDLPIAICYQIHL